ncbi:extensin family protein [Croceicoccus sp. F390]|uniref:Extensin family protein n=1 Tax=Croceicoccus esteveae TaxID=3075597 RepID=A0ABU2ZHT9_9SPHN|nr:extensin family protein [Croceicoccus sp. F390]MDT0576176.1 extensin family protein [Croceicoccus sp. F390]
MTEVPLRRRAAAARFRDLCGTRDRCGNAMRPVRSVTALLVQPLLLLVMPVLLILVLAGCSGGRSVRVAGQQEAMSSNSPQARQCRAQLAQSGVAFTQAQDLSAGQGCDSVGAVYLQSLPSDTGRMMLANLDRVACPLADSFSRWARYGVNRAAEQILGSPVSRIETFGSYSCRNVAGTTRRSAHALAEAIDISAFVLVDGRRISVLQGWNGSEAERRFLRTVHASACKRFATVLSPDYNAAHRDHLHVEAGSGRFCR